MAGALACDAFMVAMYRSWPSSLWVIRYWWLLIVPELFAPFLPWCHLIGALWQGLCDALMVSSSCYWHWRHMGGALWLLPCGALMLASSCSWLGAMWEVLYGWYLVLP